MKKDLNPGIALIIVVIGLAAIAFVLKEATRSPVADQFEQSADYSSRAACEGSASLEGKNPKDCWK